MREDLFRVHHAGNAVQPDAVAQVRIVEGGENSGGISDAAGFEQNVFDGFRALEQRNYRLDQVVANLAAHAAVGQADHVVIHPDDEFGVNVDCAEVVDEDAHAQTVVASQDAVQQRRLARAEKPGQDGDRHGFAVVGYHSFASVHR